MDNGDNVGNETQGASEILRAGEETGSGASRYMYPSRHSHHFNIRRWSPHSVRWLLLLCCYFILCLLSVLVIRARTQRLHASQQRARPRPAHIHAVHALMGQSRTDGCRRQPRLSHAVHHVRGRNLNIVLPEFPAAPARLEPPPTDTFLPMRCGQRYTVSDPEGG